MLAGIWAHKDLIGDVFTFDDLLDVHELLDVKAENERRLYLSHETANTNGH